ncbi:MAG: calcium/sodium antiporter [Balneolaceae bacterium]
MAITFLWFTAGLVALIAGAESLVRGASRLADSLGISKLVIGLTVVAFGTSAPELAVTIQAGTGGEPDILLGNVVGSNLANILLILGISAAIVPLYVNPRLIRQDVPVMIAITVLVFILTLNGFLHFRECLLLFTLLVIYLLHLARNSRAEGLLADIPKKKGSTYLNLIYVAAGLVLLIGGAGWVVDSAVLFAEAAGVSELVIGLTIVAAGTSLPEITTSVVAALRRERELVVSGIIGSNIFNLLAVLGISGMVIPEAVPVNEALLRFDLLVLLAASFACMPIFFTGHIISRGEGLVFLGYYAAYNVYLWLSSAEHAALPVFSNTMLWFVLPITLFTIIMLAIREWRKRARVWKSMHNGQ